MARRQAEQAMKQILMSGYGHYSRAYEHKLITAFLRGTELSFMEGSILDFPLANQPLRSIKNSLICSVAIMCRYAADLGADDERCYALSDYYINEIEAKLSVNNWKDFIYEISKHYCELVQKGRENRYSLPISRAIRYIDQHIYEACSLKEVALAVKVHPSYLSALFTKETNVSLTEYIRDKKINEAKVLLRDGGYSISEIAEMLGFGSVSYFSKVFHRVISCSPRAYAAGKEPG
jgi:AraC-like DNA-binding protein